MKTATDMNGEFCKKLLKQISILVLMGIFLTPARAAEVLYTFDNPGNTTTLAIDSLTADGSTTGNVQYSAWTLVPNSGPGPSGSIWDTTTMQHGPGLMGFITADIINYTNAMTWSAAVRPTSTNSSGYTTLFWAGWRRGAGETHFYVTPTGALEWYQAGKGAFTTTTSNLFKFNQWQAIGMTFDGTVGGGTLDFYVDQQLVQSFAGIGPMVGFGNAGGAVPDPNPHNSETFFGLPYNLGGSGFPGQFNGLADNIYIADRALSASEMAFIQTIPEPSMIAMVGLGGLVLLRRNRSRLSGECCKKLLKLIPMLGLMGIFISPAQAVFETGYTFESPSTQTTVLDVLSVAYDAETYSPHYGAVGVGPNLTAAAAEHGIRGLDFTSFSGVAPGFEPYFSLQTKSSTIAFQHGFTFATWVDVKGDPISAGGSPPRGYSYLFKSGSFFADIGATSIYIDPNGKLFFSNAFAFNAYNSITGATTIPTNVWNHVAVTWDDVSDTVKLYVNGALDASLPGITTLNTANTTNTPSVLSFGYGGYSTQLNGYMDDIYFSDFAKSGSDILALMAVIPEPSTVAMMSLGGLLFLRRRNRR